MNQGPVLWTCYRTNRK